MRVPAAGPAAARFQVPTYLGQSFSSYKVVCPHNPLPAASSGAPEQSDVFSLP